MERLALESNQLGSSVGERLACRMSWGSPGFDPWSDLSFLFLQLGYRTPFNLYPMTPSIIRSEPLNHLTPTEGLSLSPRAPPKINVEAVPRGAFFFRSPLGLLTLRAFPCANYGQGDACESWLTQ